jgi:hypothetical protein
MKFSAPLEFKIATEEWEFDLIHQLNYKTFVEEIPQHEPGPARRLVDKFHSENTYLICLCGKSLAGMLAMRAKRPFSLDLKLPRLDDYLPEHRSICEIRLLAVEKDFRMSHVLQGLLKLVKQHGAAQGYNLGIISGTTRQQKLYKHLGFVPFGPLVGTSEALFQPMYLTWEVFESRTKGLFADSDQSL